MYLLSQIFSFQLIHLFNRLGWQYGSDKSIGIINIGLLIFFNYFFSNSDLITNDIKKKPPSPPKRHSESITVVADLHCSDIPPDPAPCTPPWSTEERQLIASLKAQGGSDSSFKVSFMPRIIRSSLRFLRLIRILSSVYFNNTVFFAPFN